MIWGTKPTLPCETHVNPSFGELHVPVLPVKQADTRSLTRVSNHLSESQGMLHLVHRKFLRLSVFL